MSATLAGALLAVAVLGIALGGVAGALVAMAVLLGVRGILKALSGRAAIRGEASHE